MIIDHIGYVVKNIEDGIENWNKMFGYVQASDVIVNTRQKVKVVFLKKENSLIVKLIEPTDMSSPIYNLARRAVGLHHICFRTEDMKSEIERLKQNGARLLAGPEPGEAFNNEEIAFVFAKQGIKIELIETEKKALWKK